MSSQMPTPPATPPTPTPATQCFLPTRQDRMTTGGKGVPAAPKAPRISAMKLANIIISNHEDQMAILNDIYTLSRSDFLKRCHEEFEE